MLENHKHFRQIVFGIFFLFLPVILFSQSGSIDSLLRLLKSPRDDTAQIRLNYSIAEQLRSYDIPAADKYLESGYALAKEINETYYIARYFKEKGILLFGMAKYNASRTHFDSAIVMYDRLLHSKTADAKDLGKYMNDKTDCLAGKGLLSAKLFNYQESIQYYLEGIRVIEESGQREKNDYLARLYSDIASNYYELEQFENALEYDKQGVTYVDKETNLDLYLIGHLFVADDFSALSQFDSSSVYLQKVGPTIMKLNKPNLNVRFYYILGGIYRKKNDWKNALINFKKANEAAEKMKDSFQLINSEEGMAASNMNLGDLAKARSQALSVLVESNRLNVPLGRIQSLQLLTEIEERSGNIEKAFLYQKEWMKVSDSVKKEKVQRQMHETEVKYKNEKREKELLQLQKSNALQALSIQKKSTFNYFLIGSVLVLLITGFLVYRTLRSRHLLAKQQDELQRQRIRELEKDKQLVAVDSLMKGQEDERSRLAKDLHDGLGGLLSGVKFSLSNMKDNLIITAENMAVFERSLDMIDTSIRELRRVAHNMMPEMLTKFGLDEALKEYCNTISATQLLTVKYQSLGMDARLDKSMEIVVYRIIQELLNNIVKHAAAREAFVQVVRQTDRLNIVVEDNGRGFDTSVLEDSKGAGWINIRSRVNYFKGQLDIHSEKEKGTLVTIEFNL